MNSIEQKMKKEIKKEKKSNKSSSCPEEKGKIEPTRLHRDMRLVCDVFRISEESRYALRSFDAAALEDFCLMSDEDYSNLVVFQARIGKPIPPLQQRKLRVLLTWVQSLVTTENLEAILSSPNKAEGFELKESKSENDGTLKASYRVSPRKGGGTFIPADWESRFYADLPRLRKELHRLGANRSPSNWALEFLSLRWIVCGYAK
mmetsp:Transcript_7119/g.16184  ORF Transcript_7119/g.16184 Transcript_7119/m.16184 type:complete len:204 (-) Transcript_7119:4-615(-)